MKGLSIDATSRAIATSSYPNKIGLAYVAYYLTIAYKCFYSLNPNLASGVHSSQKYHFFWRNKKQKMVSVTSQAAARAGGAEGRRGMHEEFHIKTLGSGWYGRIARKCKDWISAISCAFRGFIV